MIVYFNTGKNGKMSPLVTALVKIEKDKKFYLHYPSREISDTTVEFLNNSSPKENVYVKGMFPSVYNQINEESLEILNSNTSISSIFLTRELFVLVRSKVIVSDMNLVTEGACSLTWVAKTLGLIVVGINYSGQIDPLSHPLCDYILDPKDPNSFADFLLKNS